MSAADMFMAEMRASIREAGDDHPYGSWAGGSKASGGRPSGGGGGKGEPEGIRQRQERLRGVLDARQSKTARTIEREKFATRTLEWDNATKARDATAGTVRQTGGVRQAMGLSRPKRSPAAQARRDAAMKADRAHTKYMKSNASIDTIAMMGLGGVRGKVRSARGKVRIPRPKRTPAFADI